MRKTDLKDEADAILARVTRDPVGIPGVAAIVTGRQAAIYEGAAGKRMAGGADDFTVDTVCAFFSNTKAVTGTACLKLAEDGLLDLDAPAANYAPEIGTLEVLDGFDEDGAPRLRAPRTEITTRMLLLHTAGFAYDFFNESYARLAREHGQKRIISARRAALMTPLLFDPGTGWEYGSSVDWAGQVVEGVTGMRLGAYMRQHIFEPLDMNDTAFVLTPSMRSRLACLHQRGEDGIPTPLPDFVHPQPPEIDMGGHGLYSTVPDYARFLRMWLNDGMGPQGPVLRRETVEMASRSALPAGIQVKPLPAVAPRTTNPVDFFPGTGKGWALTFMVNEEDAPTGRPAGSLSWAGLANLYYWIDRRSGVAGIWASQLFPFADATSLQGFHDLEAAVYAHLR